MKIMIILAGFLSFANAFAGAVIDVAQNRATMTLPDGAGAIKYVYCEKFKEPVSQSAKSFAEVAEKNPTCRPILSQITLEKLKARFDASEVFYKGEYDRLKKDSAELKKTIDLVDYKTSETERQDLVGSEFRYPETMVFLGPCKYGILHDESLHQTLYAANEPAWAKGKSRESALRAEIEGCSKKLSGEFAQVKATLPLLFQALQKNAADPNGGSASPDTFEKIHLEFVSLFAPEERSPEKRMPVSKYQDEKRKCASDLRQTLDKLIKARTSLGPKVTKEGLERIGNSIKELEHFSKQPELGLAACRYTISRIDAQVGYLTIMSNHNQGAVEPEKSSNLELAKAYEQALPDGFSPNGYEAMSSQQPQKDKVTFQLGSDSKLPLANP
jgi:hypothetical protein